MCILVVLCIVVFAAGVALGVTAIGLLEADVSELGVVQAAKANVEIEAIATKPKL